MNERLGPETRAIIEAINALERESEGDHKHSNTNRITAFTATTVNQKIFDANENRKAFVIINNGANIVEFTDNVRDLYGEGFPVAPTQNVNDDDFNPQGELYVVATVGDTDLRVWEILKKKKVPVKEEE